MTDHMGQRMLARVRMVVTSAAMAAASIGIAALFTLALATQAGSTLVAANQGASNRAISDQAASPQEAASPFAVNPVLPGDHPDPSIIRVGDTYWATATTSQWAPIFPLLTSRDLVTWTQVGSVFAKPPAWSAGSYWAPEIAEDRGRFFVYYTARKKDGPLCVAVATADAPGGPYTDRGPLVCQEAGSIDAVPITDEQGTRYLVWKEDGNSRKQPTPLWAQPLSADGTTLTGTPREILRNEASWEAHLIEGPFILKRDGWFYLLYSADACCGRRCNYKLGVARSRALLGPWERAKANPILVGNEAWKCPGHGSVVSLPDGRLFLLYHAYDPRGFQYVGRQGVIDEVTWGKDGWPAINGGRGPSRTVASLAAPPPATGAPAAATGAPVNWPFADEFTATDLLPGWQWPWNREPSYRIDRARVGWLVLAASGADDSALGSIVARPVQATDYVATTRIDYGGLAAGVRAGLLAYGDKDNALGISITRQQVGVWLRDKGKERLLAVEDAPAGNALYLRMTARAGTRYQFAISRDGQEWTPVGPEVNGSSLPPWDLSPRIALTAAGPEGTHVRFDWLRIG